MNKQMMLTKTKENKNRQFAYYPVILVENQQHTLTLDAPNLIDNIVITLHESTRASSEILTCKIENRSEQTKSMKMFIFIEWLYPYKENIGLYSPSNDLLWNYSSTNKLVISGSYTSENLERRVGKAVYPMNHENREQMIHSIVKGSLYYYPITQGPNVMAHKIELFLNPFQTEKVTTYGIYGESKEEVLKIHDSVKNRLAFPLKK